MSDLISVTSILKLEKQYSLTLTQGAITSDIRELLQACVRGVLAVHAAGSVRNFIDTNGGIYRGDLPERLGVSSETLDWLENGFESDEVAEDVSDLPDDQRSAYEVGRELRSIAIKR